jgi:hypothetical protein
MPEAEPGLPAVLLVQSVHTIAAGAGDASVNRTVVAALRRIQYGQILVLVMVISFSEFSSLRPRGLLTYDYLALARRHLLSHPAGSGDHFPTLGGALDLPDLWARPPHSCSTQKATGCSNLIDGDLHASHLPPHSAALSRHRPRRLEDGDKTMTTGI